MRFALLSSAHHEPDAIPWARKRDGSVVAFDPAKLASSIYAASQQLDTEDAAFQAQELSQAVLHFLADEFAGQLPTTAEISETVVKVLREIGQGPTAAVYYDYAQKRREMRQHMQVLESADVAEAPPALESPSDPVGHGAVDHYVKVESWDKGRIAWTLQTESDLDPATAREIAASVERKLLACELGRIPVSLIRELIDCELLERGLHRALSRRTFFGVSARSIEQLLARRPNPDLVHRWAGQELLRQYALQEVYSPDIAGLHHEGLLHLFDAACPGHWAAVSLDTLTVATRSSNNATFLRELETELDRLCRCVEGTIAIDALDSVLALAADPRSDPYQLADDITEILRRATRGHGVHLIVNPLWPYSRHGRRRHERRASVSRTTYRVAGTAGREVGLGLCRAHPD